VLDLFLTLITPPTLTPTPTPAPTTLASFTLAAMDPTDWAIAAGMAIAGAIVGFLLVRTMGGKTIAQAKLDAEQTRERAAAEAKNLVDKADLEAKQRVIAEREKFDAEQRGKREELRELERRQAKREDAHEKKSEELAQQEARLKQQAEGLAAKEQKVAKRESELSDLIDRQKSELMRVAQMGMEEARQILLTKIEEDVRHDAAHLVRKITEEAQTEAKDKAREITLMAVQRYASEHVSESTVRSVPIPSDDMKGRIIGREGRNIRAIEKATGVDIIVDDTPGVIVVSCFDKVRQTIAAESLLKLIQDGRIHPARIEEVVEQVRKEMDERISKHGKDAVLETNLRNIHPKISEAMGRLAFRTSYGQNVLRHSLEVAFISQLIADQLGLNGTIARRCGFLHDIGKAMDQDQEGTHPKIGHEFAKQYGEKEPVLNAILGHHGDVPATSFYTPVVMAADAVSGARPGARRESLEKYIQRLDQLQAIAMENPGVEEAHAIQAGREVRVMVDARRVSDDEAYMIAKKIADKVSAEMTFPGEIKVTVLRETRAVEVAR
jgi:ribonuclease Y